MISDRVNIDTGFINCKIDNLSKISLLPRELHLVGVVSVINVLKCAVVIHNRLQSVLTPTNGALVISNISKVDGMTGIMSMVFWLVLVSKILSPGKIMFIDQSQTKD